MQALAERLGPVLVGRSLSGVDLIGFSALKTVSPSPIDLLSSEVGEVGRRAKFLVLRFAGGECDGCRILVHLSQAGRLDLERPPKATRGRGAVARFHFGDDMALFLREYGRERKAAFWVLGSGDDGPLSRLGPEPGSAAFDAMILEGTDGRRLHTLLRDQRTVAGIGRGHVDDALHRAGISPFATLAAQSPQARVALLEAIAETLGNALERERQRVGGLSDARLGDRFVIHGRNGQPCPQCGETLQRVSYEAYEVVYCPRCQTGGKVLADRRVSRFLK